MLKVLQVRLQQYLNHELPDIQGGFRKTRGTGDQVANIQWVISKAEVEFFWNSLAFSMIQWMLAI